MTKREINKARKMIEHRAERMSTMIDGAGQCLSVEWIGGGSTIFYSIKQVTEWLASH